MSAGAGTAGPRLEVSDPVARDDLATFCARVVRLDPTAPIRVRSRDGRVEVWAPTPFDVLAAHAVDGRGADDVTVMGSDLLAALSVAGGPSVEPGTPCDERWRAALPADARWSAVGEVPGAEVDAVTAEGIAAGEGRPPGRLPSALLDRTALTVGAAAVRVPMRCLLGLAGLGLTAGGDASGAVSVSVGGSAGDDWLRLEVGGGAVVRRRRATLVLQPV